MELLYIRDRWDLHPQIDLPPLDPPPPRDRSRPPDPGVPEWEDRWLGCWQETLQWFRDQTPAPHPPTRTNPPEFPPLLWQHRYGDVGIDREALDAWYYALPIEALPPPGGSPEDRCAGAVARAWSRGLRGVISLPVAGDHAERLGRHRLLVSAGARAEPGRYRAALEATF
ncbi:hypothetical protein [Pseudactinotalea sp. HY158]|uniref:hypothetical protein n=1 Tax=Pseudactinotalea sp. HY158 TaxID=2654547 RepID=UPI00129C9335|nr:hypothetical protein [Pseudactinotalea sp. HY158]QGH68984.1 hypothetical protein GCE65_05295 [Pseudactinotalea sp. HY158]